MRTGRPIAPLSLTGEEREILGNWARRPKSAQAMAQRARIVLEAAAGNSNTSVARKLRITKQTVGKWRGRFVHRRLAGLLDEPRPGPKRKVDDAKVEEVIGLTLESTPVAATHWSTRAMAKRCGLSQSTVGRIWRAFALQPHRVEGFKLSKDPLFIEKVRDVVGLYLNPPDRALVLCVDEKAQIQALDRSQPLLPMRPGQAERRTADYQRHGTINLFAALDAKAGTVSASSIGVIERSSFAISLKPLTQACLMNCNCTWFLTTTQPTRPRPLSVGCCGTRASICISRRPVVPGLTWSNAGSRCLPKGNCAAAFTAAPANSKTRFELFSIITTEILSRSSGLKPLTRSSNRWPDFVNEFLTQDTSGL